jgi:hypothetical protein
MDTRISCVATIALASVLTPLTWAQAATAALPIPPAILNAKTVFLSNGGADGGLFPEPFSGDPNRAYFSLYSQLASAHLFQLVADPAEADLVMEIHLAAPNAPKDMNKQLGSADPLPYLRLVIYDRRSQFPLWIITEPIQWAMLQKTHDRNFDDALSNVVDDIQNVIHPASAALYAHPPARPPFQHD